MESMKDHVYNIEHDCWLQVRYKIGWHYNYVFNRIILPAKRIVESVTFEAMMLTYEV